MPKIPLGYYLYRVGGTDCILYIGRSLQPAKRLRQHATITGLNEIGTFGKVIYCNLPDSLSWQVKLYTLADCQKIVSAYYMSDLFASPTDIREERLADYQQFACASPTEQYYNFFNHHTGFLTDAEAALIWRYQPCVNVALQVARPAYPPALSSPQQYFDRFSDPADARLFLQQHLVKAKRSAPSLR
jgi:hypothetical protein